VVGSVVDKEGKSRDACALSREIYPDVTSTGPPLLTGGAACWSR
jgi:hypothetical protein